MANNIGAFFQTYKNLKATEFVLDEFRKYNPDSPVTVFSDAGNNFSSLCVKYNCNYQHRFLNLGRQGSQNSKLESSYPVNVMLAFNREEMLVWLQRFYEACLYSVENGADYIVMLEDDVYVKGAITDFPDSAADTKASTIGESGVVLYKVCLIVKTFLFVAAR